MGFLAPDDPEEIFFILPFTCTALVKISPDASLDLFSWITLEVVFASLENAIMQTLGLSTYAEILHPAELREWVVLVAGSIVDHYSHLDQSQAAASPLPAATEDQS